MRVWSAGDSCLCFQGVFCILHGETLLNLVRFLKIHDVLLCINARMRCVMTLSNTQSVLPTINQAVKINVEIMKTIIAITILLAEILRTLGDPLKDCS